jgi:hypothetical protein
MQKPMEPQADHRSLSKQARGRNLADLETSMITVFAILGAIALAGTAAAGLIASAAQEEAPVPVRTQSR